MTVLVTGASGFIGSHLVKRLTDDDEKVVSLVHDSPVWTRWLKESVKPTIKVHGDIRDSHFLRRVLNQYEVDKVYHLAAQSIVKRAYKDPVNTFDINVMGTVKLLEACRQLDVEKMIIQSTDKIYGNQIDATLESPLRATEPYGSSKIAADVAAQTFAETYGMNIVISRSCNCYGYDLANRIVSNTVRSCLRGESPVIYKDDKSERQYIYVKDLVDALKHLMDHTVPGICNICTSDVLNQEEVVLKILECFPQLKPRYVEKPDIKQIRSQSMTPVLLNWGPRYSFKEGIGLTIVTFRTYGF